MKLQADEELYRRIRLQAKIDTLLHKLHKAESDEEAGIYRLGLHLDSDSDLDFFSMDEREKIKGLLKALVNDTARHAKLLEAAARELKEKKAFHAG